MKNVNVTLAGAPNVGKSTLFNALTGLRQHTGNWTGKTVESAKGNFRRGDVRFTVTDIPGTYSLGAKSAEEEVAKRYIEEKCADVTVIVCDASSLERSLPLALQIISIAPRSALFLNLADEAEKRGVTVDEKRLASLLGVPVIKGTATRRAWIDDLILTCLELPEKSADVPVYTVIDPVAECDEICRKVIKSSPRKCRRDEILDRIFTGRLFALPVTALFLFFIFWLTVKGANVPSDLLHELFSHIEEFLASALTSLRLPQGAVAFLTEGVFRTSAWVISVMLPPMAIFFPLFTLLEDFGYLPRLAFNLDRPLRACGSCGKQALCMCEGLGCNAVGVTGCRIIDSKRERLAAMITNSFIPCNGRFPALIALSGIFFGSFAAGALTLFVALAFAASLGATLLLSKTVLRGKPSSFVLELPPYRTPKAHEVVVRSVIDRTLRVAGRALVAAAPAGGILWLLANINFSGAPLLTHAASILDPVARFIGLDGAILLAFILGLPANETVLPILIMIYSAHGALPADVPIKAIGELFRANGWTITTAICTSVFFLFHSPCATTLITIKRESKSARVTLLSFVLPVAVGAALCAVVNLISTLF